MGPEVGVDVSVEQKEYLPLLRIKTWLSSLEIILTEF
jgi:hypothetical protein